MLNYQRVKNTSEIPTEKSRKCVFYSTPQKLKNKICIPFPPTRTAPVRGPKLNHTSSTEPSFLVGVYYDWARHSIPLI